MDLWNLNNPHYLWQYFHHHYFLIYIFIAHWFTVVGFCANNMWRRLELLCTIAVLFWFFFECPSWQSCVCVLCHKGFSTINSKRCPPDVLWHQITHQFIFSDHSLVRMANSWAVHHRITMKNHTLYWKCKLYFFPRDHLMMVFFKMCWSTFFTVISCHLKVKWKSFPSRVKSVLWSNQKWHRNRLYLADVWGVQHRLAAIQKSL